MYRICDDENLINIRKTDSLINTASYYKEFSFSKYDVNYMIYCLDDWIVMDMDVAI